MAMWSSLQHKKITQCCPGGAKVSAAAVLADDTCVAVNVSILWSQGLKPRQLAVLFRNNHFNTLFKFEDALYVLVTDQGYLHEQAGHLSSCNSLQHAVLLMSVSTCVGSLTALRSTYFTILHWW